MEKKFFYLCLRYLILFNIYLLINRKVFSAENQQFAPDDPIYDLEHDFEFPKNFGPRQSMDAGAEIGTELMNTLYGEISYNRPDLWRKFCNYYFNCLRDVDRRIMMLIDTLQETDQLENTIIFMISDHGEMLGEKGMWFKQYFFENCSNIFY